MLQKFRTEPAYLNQYYRRVIALLLPACALLAWLRAPGVHEYLWYLPAIVLVVIPRFPLIVTAFAYALAVSLTTQRASFELAYLLLVPASLLLALLATSYIHNAAYDNIRPRWLRRPIGELCALFHLVGFPDWTIVHFIHHRHADHPELDPHPPAGLSYWRFMNGVKDSIFRVLKQRYFEQFGDRPDAALNWRLLPLHGLVLQLVKTHFWFLLLACSRTTSTCTRTTTRSRTCSIRASSSQRRGARASRSPRPERLRGVHGAAATSTSRLSLSWLPASSHTSRRTRCVPAGSSKLARSASTCVQPSAPCAVHSQRVTRDGA